MERAGQVEASWRDDRRCHARKNGQLRNRHVDCLVSDHELHGIVDDGDGRPDGHARNRQLGPALDEMHHGRLAESLQGLVDGLLADVGVHGPGADGVDLNALATDELVAVDPDTVERHVDLVERKPGRRDVFDVRSDFVDLACSQQLADERERRDAHR